MWIPCAQADPAQGVEEKEAPPCSPLRSESRILPTCRPWTPCRLSGSHCSPCTFTASLPSAWMLFQGLDEGTRLLVLGPSPPQPPRDPTVQEEALTQAQILLLHHPRPCCAKEKGGLSDGFCARPGTLWRRKSREVALAQAASPHRGVLAPPLTSKDLGLEHSGGAAAELPGGRDPLSGLPRRSQQEAGLEVT